MNRMLKKPAVLLMTTLLIILAGCQNSGGEAGVPNSTELKPGDSPVATSSSLPGGTVEASLQSCGEKTAANRGGGTGENAPGGSVKSGEKVIPLQWKKLQDKPAVEAAKGLPAGAKIISEIRQEDFGDVLVTVYSVEGDQDYIYADLHTIMGDFSLGYVGSYNYHSSGDTVVETTCLFAERVLKITGNVGANSSLTKYYTLDAAGQPAGLLQIDTGHAREWDVDGDGFPEATAAHGLPMTAYVYRWKNGYAEYAYLNDDLDADSVVLREDLIYEASGIGDAQPSLYRLHPEGLIKLTMPPGSK